MLPLEALMFIPSVFLTPLALAALLWLRRASNYSRLWQCAVIICILLTVACTGLTLTTPLYSERDHVPDVPGGFSVGVWGVIGVLIFWTCLVIPAFPVLIALACLPPPGQSRLVLLPLLLFVVVLAGLIAWKNARYVADYRHEKSKPRPSTSERFKHLRNNSDRAIDEAD
jgi:hypothetical protein